MHRFFIVRHVARNRLESFIRSRSEWCISRQRVWGVPIPSLHHIPSGTDILTSSSLTHILNVFEQKGTEHWWEGSVSDFVSPELSAEFGTAKEQVEIEWRKGTDTMDVWFDSGSSWATLRERGVESETIMGSDSPKTYADICVEGSDQHRGWFQSMLLTAIATSGDLRENESDVSIPPVLPYRSLITHGMVLDQSGRKMSKSIGNVMSPMTIVKGGKVSFLLLSYYRILHECSGTGQEERSRLWRRRVALLGRLDRLLARCTYRSGRTGTDV